jgi:hypothetical protein
LRGWPSGEITLSWPSPAAWTIGLANQNAAAIIAMVIDLPTVPRPWIVLLSDQLK